MVDLVSYYLPRKMSTEDMTRALKDGDDRATKEYGSSFNRTIEYDGEVMTVRWLQNPFVQTAQNQSTQATGESKTEMSSNITGASYLGTTLKDRIAQTKAKVTQVQTDIVQSLDKMDTVTAQGAQMAKSIQAEADDLAASLGQFTNSPTE